MTVTLFWDKGVIFPTKCDRTQDSSPTVVTVSVDSFGRPRTFNETEQVVSDPGTRGTPRTLIRTDRTVVGTGGSHGFV